MFQVELSLCDFIAYFSLLKALLTKENEREIGRNCLFLYWQYEVCHLQNLLKAWYFLQLQLQE